MEQKGRMTFLTAAFKGVLPQKRFSKSKNNGNQAQEGSGEQNVQQTFCARAHECVF